MAKIEKDLERGARLLNAVQHQLKSQKSAEAHRWLSEITQLQQKYPAESRSIVGVIGDTGAGKSALINALLDEERVLPTNCMRACTAVITAIGYNNSEIPYRAEVEFVSKKQWRTELTVLLGDLRDNSGNLSREAYSEDTEAGIAYAKVRAVYPALSREQITSATVDELLAHPSCAHLGGTIDIEDADSGAFCKQLHTYIDSRDRVDMRTKSAKAASDVIQYWPLIKIVRVFVKSRILEAGTILVDLPGVHDSNAARAAIAQQYIQQCSGMLIVAPINGAIDNKSAKTLLGQSFKQQLKLDGNFGNITWICSQTDVIACTEAIDSLDLAAEIRPFQEKLDDVKATREQSATRMEDLVSSEKVLFQTQLRAANDLNVYSRLLRRAEKGFTVSKAEAPGSSRKRKLIVFSSSPSKKLDPTGQAQDPVEVEEYSDIGAEDSLGESDCNEEDEEVEAEGNLEKEDIYHIVAELKDHRDAVRQEYHSIKQSIKTTKKEEHMLKDQESRISNQMTKLCIIARNDYARTAIQEDFAAGIREIDVELASENDPENFDPSKDIRNYDEVAKSLPVFCVCSRAYQKLCGRLKKDYKVMGFEDTKDTEVPQLQEHCRSMAESYRHVCIGRYLTKIELLVNSLKIWIASRDYQHGLDRFQLQRMDTALKTDLKDVTQALTKLCEDTINRILEDIDVHISRSLPSGSGKAQNRSLQTVSHWGKPVDRDHRERGGLYYMTYKAILRRNGYYAKKQTVHDFNEQLSKPLVKHLAHGWETVFVRHVPAAFENATKELEAAASAFQANISATAARHGIPLDLIRNLEQQLVVHVKAAKEALSGAKEALCIGQKDINRRFKYRIEQHMKPVYAECDLHNGVGALNRVKQTMETWVRDCKADMFRSCTEFIEQKLLGLLEQADRDLKQKTKEITDWIERDYMQLSIDKSQQLLAEEKLMKEAVTKCIKGFENEVNTVETTQVVPNVEIKMEIDS